MCVCVVVGGGGGGGGGLGNFPPMRKGVGKSGFKIGSNTDIRLRREMIFSRWDFVMVTFKSCNCKGIL